MYVKSNHFSLDENKYILSIHELTRSDLIQLYRALSTVSDVFMSDRLRELRDTIFRYLSDNLE